MRLDFLVAGLIVYAFLIWMPINGMQPQPRTVSRKLVHEKKQSLENTRKPTNQWVTIISQMPKEEESKKIDLMRLLEWDAYYNAKNDLKIYSYALRDLNQKDFNFGNVSPGEKAIPVVNPYFKVSSIENPELKSKISSIVKNVGTFKVDNFNNQIGLFTKKINAKLKDLEEQPHLRPKINPLIDGLVAQQLEKIKEKAFFTRDKDILKKDLEILSPYKKHIRGKNAILFEELEEMVKQTAEIGLPITELAPEEESSSSTSSEELPEQKTLEPELQIIPYQKSPFEELFTKIANSHAQELTIISEKQNSSSSSSSSTSPLSTPSLSPRKPDDISNITKIISHETHKPKVIPEEYISDSSSSSSSAEPSEESTLKKVPQTPVTPSQASEDESSGDTEDESSKESQSLVIPEKSAEEVNSPAPEAQQKDEKPNQLPSSSSSASSAEEPSTSGVQEPQPSLPWYSKLIEKISAFFDRFFWSIYGYR